MFKEMVQSFGIFVSYSSKKKMSEMAIFAIRQSDVQFSMTILLISPTVYTTHQSSIVDRYLYLQHSILTNWYLLLFDHRIASSLYSLVSHT